MRLLIFTLTFILASITANAQEKDSLNYGPTPKGGISALALHYFKIDFTRTQRLLLNANKIELVYSVDQYGKAALEKVNYLSDPIIIDSLVKATEKVPLFQPQVVNGKPTSSIYFLSLRFPRYDAVQENISYKKVARPRLSDFESIELGGGLDMLMGGMVNTFTGSAHDYLGTGGGMKVDMIFMGQKKFGAGMDMSFYGNPLKKDYPINSNRQQLTAPPTLFIGLACQWIISKKEKEHITFQLEANYVQQNLNTRIDANDNNWDRFSGFSPGILVHYMVKVGRDHLSSYYWDPVVVNHWLNFHAGIRPLLYNSALANGVMIEAGVSYRMKTTFIKSYLLKE
jgi:hypothetical protein